ncbi:MAG: hypothetical protein L6R36_001428 [Xanthoria steineri]|nr:MAG: hypothetical protein L6R36_001428 [Xanthoria steineri]
MLLSLADFSRTNPIQTPSGPKKDLTLPQCRRLLDLHPWPDTLQSRSSHSSSSALTSGEIEAHQSTVRAQDPQIILSFFYCPDFLVPEAALTRTLYASLRAVSNRASSEGYNALLGRSFASEEERGINCMVTFSAGSVGGSVSVGAVADVLMFLRRWMVRGRNYGAVAFAVYVEQRKVSTGLVSPRVDPVLLPSSSSKQ